MIWLSLLTACFCLAGADVRHGGHSHRLPERGGPTNSLKDKDFIRDYEHIKEDVQEYYNKDFADNLEDVEMERYYFQLHDLDKDQRLDGLEMLLALNHVLGREGTEAGEDIRRSPDSTIAIQRFWNEKFEEDSVLIDELFKDEDLNQDGFLSYFEFALARQRERDAD